MTTTNVKILLRRGLREHIGVDTLDTGEMGFAYDTNQVFIGIDDAIDEVQFDPFINAHAIIQAWLDGYEEDEDGNVISDVPFPGLEIDEDLVIRNIPTTYEEDGTPISGVQALIDAMHFYEQYVEWDGKVDFTEGEIIYLKQFLYADDRVLSSEIDKGKTYVIKVLGNTDYTLLGADENKVNVKFTATATGPLNGTGEVLQVIGTEDYTQGSVISTKHDGDRTDTTISLRHNAPIFAQDIAPQRDFYNMNKSEWGIFQWNGAEWEAHAVDHVYDHEPQNADLNYSGSMIKPLDTVGIIDDVAVVVGVSTVRYWKKKAGGWTLLGNDHEEDFQFHTTDIETQDVVVTPLDRPDRRSNGNPLEPGDYYIDYSRDLQQGLKLIISEFDSLEPRIEKMPADTDLGNLSPDELDKYFRYNDTFVPIFTMEKIALQDMLPDQLIYGLPDIDGGTATITLRERDDFGHENFTDYEYNNTHRSFYFTKERVGSVEQTDFADTTYVEHAEVPEFEAPYYARSRRNVEVITENSYNQLFADQHLSALSHHTGRRSSLFRKVYNVESGVFLRYLHDVCTTFFVDYSLIQKNSSKKFLRVGQLKVINGYPHGMQFAKLTDDHTEMWQDFNNDNFAEMYPEQEFSNIQFDVKREDVILMKNTLMEDINKYNPDPNAEEEDKKPWFEWPENTTGIIGKVKQVGEDVIITSQDPLWDYATMINDLSNSFQSIVSSEKGDDLQIYFQQDPGYNVEISYTVKRWSM